MRSLFLWGQQKEKYSFSLRSGLFKSSLFFKKKLAENHHVREWALVKLVGAHDDFSAGYKHDTVHLNIL